MGGYYYNFSFVNVLFQSWSRDKLWLSFYIDTPGWNNIYNGIWSASVENSTHDREKIFPRGFCAKYIGEGGEPLDIPYFSVVVVDVQEPIRVFCVSALRYDSIHLRAMSLIPEDCFNELKSPWWSVVPNATLRWSSKWSLPHCYRVNSRFAPSQWETSLQSNAVFQWLGANLELACC